MAKKDVFEELAEGKSTGDMGGDKQARELVEKILEPVADPPALPDVGGETLPGIGQPPDGDAPAEKPAPDPNRKREAREWATDKGHLPTEKQMNPQMRGEVHQGRHLAVMLAHSKLAVNSLLTEADYERLMTEAYSLPIGETAHKS